MKEIKMVPDDFYTWEEKIRNKMREEIQKEYQYYVEQYKPKGFNIDNYKQIYKDKHEAAFEYFGKDIPKEMFDEERDIRK